MLPAYFASSFPNRSILVAMTAIFFAGIATVILPLAMGASVLRQLFTAEHTYGNCSPPDDDGVRTEG